MRIRLQIAVESNKAALKTHGSGESNQAAT